MKKIVSILLLAVMMLACLAPLSAQAADLTGKSTVEDYAYVKTVYPKATGHCYIREAPNDMEKNILVTAKDGDEVYVYYTGYTNGGKKYWAYVRHVNSDEYGYMWADNLSYAVVEKDYDTNLTGKTVVCELRMIDTVYPKRSGHSYIREKPNDMEKNQVVTGYDGDEVFVYYTGYTNGGKRFWAFVKHMKSEKYGYMWADNLSTEYVAPDYDPSLTGKSIVYKYATVDTVYPKPDDHCYVREEPDDMDNNHLCTAYDDDEVFVYYTGYTKGGKRFWAFVEHTKSGERGYMWADNLSYE